MIVQSFIGSDWTNASRFVKVDESQLFGGPLWSHLRQDLENGISGGLQKEDQLLDKHRNRRTQIVGYVQDIAYTNEVPDIQDIDFRQVTRLKSNDLLQDGACIFCVRQSMPIGGKTHTPLHRNKAFLSLQQEARDIEAIIAEGPRYQMMLREAKGPQVAMYKERLDKIHEKFARREVVHGQLDSLKKKASQHVSDLVVQVHTKETEIQVYEDVSVKTTCEQTDVGVPPTQKCFECMALGSHHNEACFLQTRIQRDERPLWSTSKFKVAWNAQMSDSD